MGAGTSTLKPFVPTVALTNAPVLYYPVPTGISNFIAQVTSIIITNRAAADHNIYIYNVPAGGTAVDGVAIFDGNVIPAKTTWFVTVGGDGVEIMTMFAGGAIWAKADANDVINLTVSGREVSG